MRITQNMLTGFANVTLQQSQSKLLKTQTQLSTGNKINKASDDPTGMRKILDYRGSLSRIAQYKDNISIGKERIKTAESTLDTIQDLLTEAKEIALDNEGNEPSVRATAAESLRKMYDQVMSLANTRMGEDYLFAGYETGTVPFTRDDDYNATYSGDDNAFHIKTGDTSRVEINTSGDAIFTGASVTDGVNVFDALRDAAAALETDPLDSVAFDDAIHRLDQGGDQIQVARQGISMRYSQLESTETSLDSMDEVVTGFLSETQKVDTAQAAVELKAQQLAYEVALSTVSTMFDLNLMKFLS